MTRSATAKATIVYMVPKRIVKEEPKIWKRKESPPTKAKTEEPRPRNEGMRWDEEMGLKIYFELKTLSENKSISLEDAVKQIETAFYFHSWCMSEEERQDILKSVKNLSDAFKRGDAPNNKCCAIVQGRVVLVDDVDPMTPGQTVADAAMELMWKFIQDKTKANKVVCNHEFFRAIHAEKKARRATLLQKFDRAIRAEEGDTSMKNGSAPIY